MYVCVYIYIYIYIHDHPLHIYSSQVVPMGATQDIPIPTLKVCFVGMQLSSIECAIDCCMTVMSSDNSNSTEF